MGVKCTIRSPQVDGSLDALDQQTFINTALYQVDQQQRLLASERKRHTADLAHQLGGVEDGMLDEMHQQAAHFK